MEVRSDLPAGTLLRVQLDRTAKLKAGTLVTGHLIDAIYQIDRSVIPAGSLISGHVATTTAVPARERVWPLLDGDVTPTRQPHIVFDTLRMPDGAVLSMAAVATERAASLVAMQSTRRHGRAAIVAMVKTAVHNQVQQIRETYFAPGKKDRLERAVFAQLPYHPQRIWRATQFDAELTSPLRLEPSAPPVCADTPTDQLPQATLHARLLTGISSKKAKAGDTVQAVLAQPVYAEDSSRLLLPENAHMSGTVIRSRPARRFGRSGVLRFTLKEVTLEPERSCAGQLRASAMALHGQLTGVESAPGSNLKLNEEGEAQAGPSPNQVLAPLVLAILLTRTRGEDGSNAGTGAVSGGGFGLVGRVVSLSTRDANVTAGFAYYALGKSLVRRFLLKGHEVEFPRNTRFDIEVSPRPAEEKPLR